MKLASRLISLLLVWLDVRAASRLFFFDYIFSNLTYRTPVHEGVIQATQSNGH